MTVTTETAAATDAADSASGIHSGVWNRALECSPYSGRPVSIREVVDYTRAGGWVPGEHPWWVEAPGYVYGWLVAVPVTVVLYGVSWVVQRPMRLLMVVFVAGLLWSANTDRLAETKNGDITAHTPRASWDGRLVQSSQHSCGGVSIQGWRSYVIPTAGLNGVRGRQTTMAPHSVFNACPNTGKNTREVSA